jgi:hypothetical protein
MCKVYDVINCKIMELLESGTVPWRKTWTSTGGNQPTNIVSRKEYCVFRGKSATDSDGSRPPIPIQVGHLFRLISATP